MIFQLADLEADDLRAFAAAALTACADDQKVVEHRWRGVDAASEIDAVEHGSVGSVIHGHVAASVALDQVRLALRVVDDDRACPIVVGLLDRPDDGSG